MRLGLRSMRQERETSFSEERESVTEMKLSISGLFVNKR